MNDYLLSSVSGFVSDHAEAVHMGDKRGASAAINQLIGLRRGVAIFVGVDTPEYKAVDTQIWACIKNQPVPVPTA